MELINWFLIVFVALAVAIGLALPFGFLARSKGYSFAGFFFLCFFLGVFGYFIVAALPNKKTYEAVNALSQEVRVLHGQVQYLNARLEQQSFHQNSMRNPQPPVGPQA